ncbi:V-type ATPase 116kDa subunit family-domain-containing protein [Phaeosphaeriaceae sp. PMI808]|nr:V-type ATPase 116kDa subunit family-domain-containing protein [Phaeosphaeriaceae sp. PMI808]
MSVPKERNKKDEDLVPSAPSAPLGSYKSVVKPTQEPVEPTTSSSYEHFNWYWETFPPTLEQRTRANTFFINNRNPPRLVSSVARFMQVPESDVPEVAFVGRSNVGKSSLLNAIVDANVKDLLARTSSTPGFTKTMNFYGIGPGLGVNLENGADGRGKIVGHGGLVIVDMPGYGEGSLLSWGVEIMKYIQSRKQLRRVFVLLDTEHGIKDKDRSLLASLRLAGVSHQVIMSKMDKLYIPESKDIKHFNGKKSHKLKPKGRVEALREEMEKIKNEIKPPVGGGALGEVLACSSEVLVGGRRLGIDHHLHVCLATPGPTVDTMLRSADMSLTQLYIANEIGREVVSALGELGTMDFRDLNAETTAFQRTFTQEIRRLDNVERQLRYFRAQMEKSSISMRSIYDFNNPFTSPSASEIDELADKSQSLEQRIASLNESYETLKKREVELTEWRWVLREAGGFFDRARGQTEEIRQSMDSNDDAPLLRDVEQNGQNEPGAERSFTGMNIDFVAGVIPRERMGAFERILWRTLRGNLYMNQSEIPEPIINPENNEETSKNVFIIFAHGKDIIAKIRKISESLGADLYSVDENSELRRDQTREVNTRLSDLASVLKNTKSTLDAELTVIGRNLAAWMVIIKKEKATYETLNKFSYDHQRKTLIAEAWAPTNALGLIKSTLADVNERAGLSVPTIVNQVKTTKTPPTFFKTNRFTLGFQTIIDAYGTIKYREINPALPAIVTFPFMFAVMFGDAGHGVILLLAASAMIYFERRLERSKLDELFSMMFYGRYIVLMMGIFSIYTGLLYCDAFSLGLPWFKSMWVWDEDGKGGLGPTASRVEGYTYPFGLDYRWHDTENDLLFSNSYKMKLSILLGWCHMTFSLMWSLVNARYFKTKIDIWGNFVPGMIFFQSIFGYLAFTIVYKWTIDWPARGESPPSLLNMLIFMFLQPGTLEPGTSPLYPGQAKLQTFLVLLALTCVPILLFLKPFYLRYEHNKARAMGYRGISESTRVSALDDDDEEEGNMLTGGRESFGDDDDGIAMITQDIGHSGDHEEFEFSEVMIHQVIHTIEFCLNCVSHTASYLRLWALSLAHQRLSIVLWEMTMKNAFVYKGITGSIVMVMVFYFWFTATVMVLCVMEGTSAMLHSLRLHWVEAMSKHFIGDGVAFEPFSFKVLLEEEPVE